MGIGPFRAGAVPVCACLRSSAVISIAFAFVVAPVLFLNRCPLTVKSASQCFVPLSERLPGAFNDRQIGE
jgi:hypothetical protein